MRGGVKVHVTLRRLMGVELACLELGTLIRLSGLGVGNFKCGDGWAEFTLSNDVNALLRVMNRAALVREVRVNGVRHRPTLVNALPQVVKTDSPHLNPLHALLMINLSGVREGPLLDPFSGLGTIPRVAGRLGIWAVGCDIKNPHDAICDASNPPVRSHSIQAVVTDPPFNRVFRVGIRLSGLYLGFLESIIDALTDEGAVVMMTPSYLLSLIIDEAYAMGLTPYCLGVDHVHGALSRFIVCLSKSNKHPGVVTLISLIGNTVNLTGDEAELKR